MDNTFSMERFMYFLRKDILGVWRKVAIISATIGGIIILYFLLSGYMGNKDNTVAVIERFFTLILWVGGLVVASLSFGELYNKNQNDIFLLLPASAFEKVSSRLILVSVALPIFVLLLTMITSLAVEGLTSLLFQYMKFEFFNPLQKDIWESIGDMVVFQSLFFLGAAWFKRYHFIKTVTALIPLCVFWGIFLCFIMFSYLIIKIGSDIQSFETFRYSEEMMLFTSTRLFHILSKILNILYYCLLAPFCWFTTWLCVREAQTSDAV